MDEIEKRLRDVTEGCLKALQAWHAAKKNAESREDLQDAIHELRKVAARLEIDIAVSERDEMASRPIPIPPHRATRGGGRKDEDDDNAGNFNEGNGGYHQGVYQGSHGSHGGGGQRHVLRRRSQGPHGGGGGGHKPSEE
jgi:hypothetical protein